MKVTVASPFGVIVDPDVLCSECGQTMIIRKREPVASSMTQEDQYFSCMKCGHVASRRVDDEGNITKRSGL